MEPHHAGRAAPGGEGDGTGHGCHEVWSKKRTQHHRDKIITAVDSGWQEVFVTRLCSSLNYRDCLRTDRFALKQSSTRSPLAAPTGPRGRARLTCSTLLSASSPVIDLAKSDDTQQGHWQRGPHTHKGGQGLGPQSGSHTSPK